MSVSIPYAPARQLFRDALRVVRLQRSATGYPPEGHRQTLARDDPHRRKLASNVRQLFELYRNVKHKDQVEKLIQMGRHDVEVLRALAKAEEMGLGR